MIQIGNILNRLILAGLKAVGGELETIKIHLFTAGPAMTPNSLWADFTEATFTGYVSKSVAWLNPETQAGNLSVLPSQLVQFESTGSAITENVLGWVATYADAPGPALFAFGGTFDAPIPFAGVGDTLTMAIQFPLDGTNDVSAIVVD